jgi:hypothetical protein
VANNSAAWLRRARDVRESFQARANSEILPFSTSLLAAMYGPQSPQMTAFDNAMNQISRSCQAQKMGLAAVNQSLGRHAFTVVGNVIAEIESGLIGNIRAQVAGEVLAELVGLAKEVLTSNEESAKNVATVLVAAAYEDLIRRMGSEFAAVVGRPKLESVIGSLKDAGVLQGAAVGTALSYLKFRNDSLHADWNNVDRPQVQSCLAFIEGLLLKHFS